MSTIHIKTPLNDIMVRSLSAGDEVFLSGTIFTGRDAAHKRLISLLDEGKSLPVDLAGQVIYYAGPTPAKPGRPIGSAGPTTSGRMDVYSPRLLSATGLKGMIGKGRRSLSVVEAIKNLGCVYFAATGGAGAFISARIKSAAVVCWEDLGPEAIYKLEVENMPLIVAVDSRGNDLYESGPAQFRK